MVNAVISEFNPFHNGHKYLLETAKQKTNADYTVCFMSPNFVQRGEPAVCNKHIRAVAAVKNGADIVFELPTAHALAGASVFADAGVFLASSLGVPTFLCFGTEDEDIMPLFRLALTDKQKLARAFKKNLESGKSYGDAVMQAYTDCGMGEASLLRSPNNLLAFEYIKAVIEQKSNVKVVNVKRVGSAHDSDTVTDNFVSASYIRNNEGKDFSDFMPQAVEHEINKQKFDELLLYSIYSKSPSELLAYADMNEGLENKFHQAALSSKTASELIDRVKSKRYTHSKLRRIAMSVMIANPKDLCKQKPPYLRVLAFNDNGRELLKTLKDTASLPIVTKPADADKIENAKPFFDLECRATNIYDFCSKDRKSGGREYKISPTYVKNP